MSKRSRAVPRNILPLQAYRVIKPGGVACMIGPVHPTHPVSRFFADVWMLFPTEEEYIEVRLLGLHAREGGLWPGSALMSLRLD